MFEVIFASRPGFRYGAQPDHLPEHDPAGALADRRQRGPALEHRLVGGHGHVVEVVVGPQRVESELLGEHGHLDGLGPLGLRVLDRGQLHLPTLRDEHTEREGHGNPSSVDPVRSRSAAVTFAGARARRRAAHERSRAPRPPRPRPRPRTTVVDDRAADHDHHRGAAPTRAGRVAGLWWRARLRHRRRAGQLRGSRRADPRPGARPQPRRPARPADRHARDEPGRTRCLRRAAGGPRLPGEPRGR